MARNLSGRRRDNTLLLTPDLTFERRSEAARTANDCGVAPPLVCLTNVYVLGNMPDRKTPYMFQYLFNVQRELGGSTALEVGYLGSHSYRLERMFDWNETIPWLDGIGAEPQAVSGVHEGPGDRQRRRGPLQFAGRQADPPAAPGIVGARRLHVFEVDGQRQRHPHAQRRHAVPAEQLLPRLRVGLVGVRRAPPVVASILYELPFGHGKPFLQDGVGGAILGGWQISTIINDLERIPAHGLRRHRSIEYRRRAGPSECDRIWIRRCRAISRRSRAGSTPTRTCCSRWARSATPAATRSSVPGITNVDASIIRNFRMRASKTLQFRLEAFNVLNNPIWNDPNTTLTSPLYGTINTTRKPMREMQLGLEVRVLTIVVRRSRGCGARWKTHENRSRRGSTCGGTAEGGVCVRRGSRVREPGACAGSGPVRRRSVRHATCAALSGQGLSLRPGDQRRARGRDEERRTFFLDYPCDLKPGEKVMFVLSLHGAGSFGNWQRHYFPLLDYKDKYRLVIATPTAPTARLDATPTMPSCTIS